MVTTKLVLVYETFHYQSNSIVKQEKYIFHCFTLSKTSFPLKTLSCPSLQVFQNATYQDLNTVSNAAILKDALLVQWCGVVVPLCTLIDILVHFWCTLTHWISFSAP